MHLFFDIVAHAIIQHRKIRIEFHNTTQHNINNHKQSQTITNNKMPPKSKAQPNVSTTTAKGKADTNTKKGGKKQSELPVEDLALEEAEEVDEKKPQKPQPATKQPKQQQQFKSPNPTSKPTNTKKSTKKATAAEEGEEEEHEEYEDVKLSGGDNENEVAQDENELDRGGDNKESEEEGDDDDDDFDVDKAGASVTLDDLFEDGYIAFTPPFFFTL